MSRDDDTAMYDRTFGTDWDELTREEAIHRAFALGVVVGVGAGRSEEYDSVRAAVDSPYDRSLVELAYDEGRTKALEAPESEPEAVWGRLVDEDGAVRSQPLPAALPGALSELTIGRKPREGPPSSLTFPSMFRK